jgi:hypothetical protein
MATVAGHKSYDIGDGTAIAMTPSTPVLRGSR